IATRLAGASAFISLGMQSPTSVAAPVVANISRLFISSTSSKPCYLGYDRLRVPYLISRRSFVKLVAAAPLARAFAGERNMFLSLNSVLLQGRVQWPEFARLAAKSGFPGTDIMLRPAMQAGVNATNDLLAQLKIRPAVIDFPVEFRKDDATFNASLSQLEGAARFAAAIHCPRMITYIMP